MGLSVEIKKQLGSFCLEASFEAQGEKLALLGASGSGKSVTLKCIAGIMRPDEGRISMDGVILFDSAAGIDLPPQRRRLGYLFQNYALFPNMSVRQNIAVAVGDRKRRVKFVQEKLRQFQLEDVADKRPGQLSGGQQQRTALARILASEPAAILLDEPFSALDNYLKYQLELEMTEMLDSFAGPIVWVSHDRGEVFRNCRRVCVMDKGRSQKVRTLSELFSSPGTEAAARISGCKNYAKAVAEEDRVRLPQWGLVLRCVGPVEESVSSVGIRSHHVRLAAGERENVFACQVVRVVEDIFSTIVLLRPEGAAEGAALLRMELDKESWGERKAGEHISVCVRPEDILLLN